MKQFSIRLDISLISRWYTHEKLLAVILAVPLAATAGWFGPSDEEKKLAKDECPKFIEKNMKRRKSIETKIFDIYTKKGKVVVEVGYKDKYSDDSYSVRLCVLDSEKGTISSPSPMNESEWRK
jgi:hypothetical protein